jgi:hypothetical protein
VTLNGRSAPVHHASHDPTEYEVVQTRTFIDTCVIEAADDPV